MTYAIEINEVDASDAVTPRQDEEPLEEFHARVDDARGKSFFVITLLDVSQAVNGSAKAQQLFSPYFVKDSDESRFNVLSQAMKKAKTAIVDKERKKPKATELRIVG